MKLSPEILLEKGFEHREPVFENETQPFFVKQGVCLFYFSDKNPPYLLGFAIGHGKKFYVATYRRIETVDELGNVFNAIV